MLKSGRDVVVFHDDRRCLGNDTVYFDAGDQVSANCKRPQPGRQLLNAFGEPPTPL